MNLGTVERLLTFLASGGRAERSVRCRPRDDGGFEATVSFGWGVGAGEGATCEEALLAAFADYDREATCSGCGCITQKKQTEEELGEHMRQHGWKQYSRVNVLWKYCKTCQELGSIEIEALMDWLGGRSAPTQLTRLRIESVHALIRARRAERGL